MTASFPHHPTPGAWVRGRRVLVVSHVPWEGPGLVADALDRHGVTWASPTLLESCDTDALPAVDDLAGLMVMGGPTGALDTEAHPGLADELELVRGCAR